MTTGPGQPPTVDGLDVAAFRRDGHVSVPDFLTDARLHSLRGWVSEIEAWPEDGGGWFQHDELGERGVVRTRTENFSPFHDRLCALVTTGALPAMAGLLLGEPAVLYKEKVNYKHPGGAGFAAHQDAPAYPHLPVSVSCLLAVDDAGVENGCLELASGMHQRLLPTDDDGCVHPDVAEDLTWDPVPVTAGSLLWFHSHTPHRSAANSSDRSRRALYLTYNALSVGDLREAYYTDKRAAFAALGGSGVAGAQRVSLIGHFQGIAPPRSPR
ncbi:phytanoyl-CoA dioxygenase family protein [Pseudonocardia spinosispora]|uniref:phytanoyl-CoA dioxygenase family protein n=1 Tax=Pseudonocardia spinosispora TaxID=103441 RepID=UPI0007E8C7B3|nr:phytanoyl-CoA dioxygenase family protein [Pseudonocardia spinosispora]